MSRNWHAITWVSNYRYSITTFCNWIPVIGHLRHSCVNYMHFNGFIRNVFLVFVRLLAHTTDFCTQRRFSKSSYLEICKLIRLISNWTSCRTIQRVIVLVISNRTHTHLKLPAQLLPELYPSFPNYYLLIILLMMISIIIAVINNKNLLINSNNSHFP